MAANQSLSNTLYTNDNLYVLSGLNTGSVDLIYLDPPFNSKRTFTAPAGSKAAGTSFKDMWTWNDVDEHNLDTLAVGFPSLTQYITSIGSIHGKPMMAYLTYMSQRIVEMHRTLKDSGSLYLHCDPTASHYLKIVLDGIFGKKNFVNEIIWHYSWGLHVTTRWNRKHDTILMYAKTGERNIVFNADPVREAYSKASKMTKDPKWNKSYNEKGKLPEDVWNIPTINAMSKERTGYPTQKPLELIRRIILASSNEGDIVMDPFCGCATTCVAAQQLQRRWIGIDIEKQAVNVLVQRLIDDAGVFEDFAVTNLIPKRSDIKEVQPSDKIKQDLCEQQNSKCNACGTQFEIRHLEIDHIIPQSKGGGDYYENYQLLCSSCTRIKGDRPMEYLRLKIETRERMAKTRLFLGE